MRCPTVKKILDIKGYNVIIREWSLGFDAIISQDNELIGETFDVCCKSADDMVNEVIAILDKYIKIK